MKSHLLPTSFLCLGAFVSACSPPPPSVTVGMQQLIIAEQAYGVTTANTGYCAALDTRSQIEVMITDFSLCSVLKPNASNQVVFHSSEERNLRFVFPNSVDVLRKVPFQTVFNVFSTHLCKDNTNSATAVAYFSHNPPAGATYDLDVEADSGTITVNYFQMPNPSTGQGVNATGTFDLHFGADHIAGSFDAAFCRNLLPGLGK